MNKQKVQKEQVLQARQNNPEASYGELAKMLGISKQRVWVILNK
jgi:DNA-binding Lrp family transcriptional regulator